LIIGNIIKKEKLREQGGRTQTPIPDTNLRNKGPFNYILSWNEIFDSSKN
jgi:hypothetical protein